MDTNTRAYQEALTEAEKQAARQEANRFAAWTPQYRPYCVQTHVKCKSPRMNSMPYGFRCPNCGNMIGHDGIRLQESPLNKRPEHTLLPTRIDIGILRVVGGKK